MMDRPGAGNSVGGSHQAQRYFDNSRVSNNNDWTSEDPSSLVGYAFLTRSE